MRVRPDILFGIVLFACFMSQTAKAAAISDPSIDVIHNDLSSYQEVNWFQTHRGRKAKERKKRTDPNAFLS